MRRDGCTVSGWSCPACGSDVAARVIHLEPPYGALVQCEARVVDPDWGLASICGHEYAICF